MKNVYSKSDFPEALPGMDKEHWQEADTPFEVPDDGKYIVAISAAAKNAAQNKSTDDDDLRVEIDDYPFGQHEVHQDKISWKGFGTAAAWDGASLQGGSKTVFFFVNLAAGAHAVRFWADETPVLREIQVLEIGETGDGAIEDVIFEFREKAPGQKVDVHGIPWKSFVFAPGFNIVKLADIAATCQSGKQKGGTDGDNIKIYVNGQIVRSPTAPTSDKYKNFFFSGDLLQGQAEALMLDGKQLLFNSSDISIELWYDETPVLERVKFELIGGAKYDQQDYFDRRLSQLVEVGRLPHEFQNVVTVGNIHATVRGAEEAAILYAKRRGFVAIGDQGRLRMLLADNEPDALRHFTWNVFLTREFDEGSAGVITTHHEIFWMEITNKQELPRAGVMDMWNNKRGREYAAKYPDKDHLELFEMAKSEGQLILNLEEVTMEHREEVERIINDMQDGT